MLSLFNVSQTVVLSCRIVENYTHIVPILMRITAQTDSTKKTWRIPKIYPNPIVFTMKIILGSSTNVSKRKELWSQFPMTTDEFYSSLN